MTNQEALWLNQSGGIKVRQIRRHYSSTNQELLWLCPAVKAKGSQCKWQRIQGVLALLLFLTLQTDIDLFIAHASVECDITKNSWFDSIFQISGNSGPPPAALDVLNH